MTPLLDVADVAALLNIRPALVRALAHRGDLPYVRVGAKLMRFREQDVASFVAAQASPARRKRRVAEVLRAP